MSYTRRRCALTTLRLMIHLLSLHETCIVLRQTGPAYSRHELTDYNPLNLHHLDFRFCMRAGVCWIHFDLSPDGHRHLAGRPIPDCLSSSVFLFSALVLVSWMTVDTPLLRFFCFCFLTVLLLHTHCVASYRGQGRRFIMTLASPLCWHVFRFGTGRFDSSVGLGSTALFSISMLVFSVKLYLPPVCSAWPDWISQLPPWPPRPQAKHVILTWTCSSCR